MVQSNKRITIESQASGTGINIVVMHMKYSLLAKKEIVLT